MIQNVCNDPVNVIINRWRHVNKIYNWKEKVTIMNLIGSNIVCNENEKENKIDTKILFAFLVNILQLNMTSRSDLNLEQKTNLIRESEHALFYRELKDKFQASIGAISSIFINTQLNIDVSKKRSIYDFFKSL